MESRIKITISMSRHSYRLTQTCARLADKPVEEWLEESIERKLLEEMARPHSMGAVTLEELLEGTADEVLKMLGCNYDEDEQGASGT